MLVLGHIAAATVPARLAFRDVDLRWVVFWTLLADIVDKPFGLIIFKDSINNGRVWFHSLLVNLLLTAFLLLLRKPLIYPLALWMHQFCDRMWQRPWVALWPFTSEAQGDFTLSEWIYNLWSPYNMVSESIGLLVVLYLLMRHRLYRSSHLRELLFRGRLPVST